MAIDKQNAKALLEGFNDLFDITISSVPNISPQISDKVKEIIIGETFKEIDRLIINGRGPRIYLLGRSGHGKSSVINRLSNQNLAEIGGVAGPTTSKAELYNIRFEDRFARWEVIDSRGLFETTKPKDVVQEKPSFIGGIWPAKDKTPVDMVKEDLEYYKPDIILHVISAPEHSNLEKDFEVIKKLGKVIKPMPKTIIVLNKADTLGNPRDWPPEQFPKKTSGIESVLKYMTDKVLKVESQPIDYMYNFKGSKITNSSYLGIVPIAVPENDEDVWNLDTLSSLIADCLPDETIIEWEQSLRRKDLLRKVANRFIKKFSIISAMAGAIPIPGADLAILIPLQVLMISVIGGLSCRSFSMKTVAEYGTAVGINIGGNLAGKQAAKTLIGEFTKAIPIIGSAFGSLLASTTTYAIGKSAEAYFFADEIKPPMRFTNNAEQIQHELIGTIDEPPVPVEQENPVNRTEPWYKRLITRKKSTFLE